jgi:hypothetical protein
MALRDFFGRLRGGNAPQPTPEQPQAAAPAPVQEAPLPEPEAPPVETPPPEAEAPAKTGWFARLKAGLSRSTAKLTESVVSLLHKRRLDDEALEELEETLITADLGVAASRRIVEGFRRTRFGKEVSDEEVKAALADLRAAPAPVGRSTRRAARAPRSSTPRQQAAPAGLDATMLNQVQSAIGAVPEGASRADVLAATGISAAQWTAAIRALLASSAVIQTGERRGARYQLSGGRTP